MFTRPEHRISHDYYSCGHIKIGGKTIQDINIKGFRSVQKIREHLGGDLACTQCAIDGRWKK